MYHFHVLTAQISQLAAGSYRQMANSDVSFETSTQRTYMSQHYYHQLTSQRSAAKVMKIRHKIDATKGLSSMWVIYLASMYKLNFYTANLFTKLQNSAVK